MTARKPVAAARLQAVADKVCDDFAMPRVTVVFNARLTRRYGQYRYGQKLVELAVDIPYKRIRQTVLHELAHHLHRFRFDTRVLGYYKMEMWPVSEPVPDRPGWFQSGKELAPVCIWAMRTHGKQFAECLRDIQRAQGQ